MNLSGFSLKAQEEKATLEAEVKQLQQQLQQAASAQTSSRKVGYNSTALISLDDVMLTNDDVERCWRVVGFAQVAESRSESARETNRRTRTPVPQTSCACSCGIYEGDRVAREEARRGAEPREAARGAAQAATAAAGRNFRENHHCW